MSPHVPVRLDPPERLLCGPGPSNVSPNALSALRRPMLGHLDPDFHDILVEVSALLRQAYRANGGLVLALQATGTSGMETGLLNLIEPGEVVIVGSCGYFGRRICELAQLERDSRRCSDAQTSAYPDVVRVERGGTVHADAAASVAGIAGDDRDVDVSRHWR